MNSFWLRAGLIVLFLSVLIAAGGGASVLANFDTRHLLSALYVQPIVLLGLFLQGVRHAVLIDQPGLSYLTATKAVALSQGLNLLLPARLSEVLKATYLRDRAKVPMSAGVSAVLLERTVDLIIVGLLGFGSLFFFAAMVSKALVWTFIVMAAIILCIALWGGGVILAFVRVLPWPRIGGLVEHAYLHFASTLKKRGFFLGLGLGFLIWGTSFLNVYLLLSIAGSPPLGMHGALLVFVCTTIGGAVPALPGGLGIYEAAAVFALTSLGYSFADALTLAVTIHGAQLVLPLLLALVVMLTERLGLSSLIKDLRANTPNSRG